MSNQIVGSSVSKRIVFLDYLRVFAFSTVLVGHKFYGEMLTIVSSTNIHSTVKLIVQFALTLVYGGAAGVVVFFMVSGYIITHVLQTENYIEFAIKRVCRIYPLYIVALSFSSIMSKQIPSFRIFISQLLLIGDFFNTPYGVGGVEWTLRIEILFYVFMGFLKYLGVIDSNKKFLPIIIVLTTALLGALRPWPSSEIWTKAYVTIYSPFLFIGVIFYLREIRKVSLQFLIFFSFYVYCQYYYFISKYQPNWLGEHYAIFSYIIFSVTWYYRSYFELTPMVRFVSNLTYSVYLFHTWIWQSIKDMLISINITHKFLNIQILTLLLGVCYIMFRYVEQPGIRLGRFLLARLNSAIKQRQLGSDY
jgi:peptidoglycan/LPS O-acetylase OafA/YrhL